MKLIETYSMHKIKYPKYVIMIKCGNFYEVIGEEAYIINNLFDYKIKEFCNTKKVGFPIISYNKVTSKLNDFKINYLTIDDGTTKKKFKNNNYDKYIGSLDIDSRINNIKEKLVILKESSSIVNILKSIETII